MLGGAEAGRRHHDASAGTLGLAERERLPARMAAMTLDVTSTRIVLFGGGPRRTEFPADTWTFDGSGWERSP